MITPTHRIKSVICRTIAKSQGFTLIELVASVMVAAILVAIASQGIVSQFENAKHDGTRDEMREIARAIAGNPNTQANGARTDFGYVGDVGNMPPNLAALLTNPGGYSTWDGPYIKGNFAAADYQNDEWGVAYGLTDTLLQSTGSGTNIDKVFAASTQALLTNTVSGTVLDANRQAPGSGFVDSVRVMFTYPNGAGGMTNLSSTTNASGYFSFVGIPVGNHVLRIISMPLADTMTYEVTVYPARDVSLEVIFPADIF
jgi:prepilin-type N-terminal cleavage/methylation domain-containing protein